MATCWFGAANAPYPVLVVAKGEPVTIDKAGPATVTKPVAVFEPAVGLLSFTYTNWACSWKGDSRVTARAATDTSRSRNSELFMLGSLGFWAAFCQCAWRAQRAWEKNTGKPPEPHGPHRPREITPGKQYYGLGKMSRNLKMRLCP